MMNGLLPQVFVFHAPSTTKSVYVCGSWNNYAPSALEALERGLWTVTINIPITIASQPNADYVQKYWYYYLVDNVRQHDRKHDHETESTTGQILNHFIFSIKSCKDSSASHIANGIPLSRSRIKLPTPINPSSKNLILTFEHTLSVQQSPIHEVSQWSSTSDEESCSESGEDKA